jgi:hypothetical protein
MVAGQPIGIEFPARLQIVTGRVRPRLGDRLARLTRCALHRAGRRGLDNIGPPSALPAIEREKNHDPQHPDNDKSCKQPFDHFEHSGFSPNPKIQPSSHF